VQVKLWHCDGNGLWPGRERIGQKGRRQNFPNQNRPANNPIIVHIASVEMAKRCVTVWPDPAEKLARAFWPGPLTIVLPCAKKIPGIVTAGGKTVGVRWPGHPFIQAVIRECGFPLAARARICPGMFRQRTPSMFTGSSAINFFDRGWRPIASCIESAVLDLTVSPPQVLRPGMIHAVSLEAVMENIQHPTPTHREPASNIQHSKLKSPGLLRKHYAPKAKLFVLNWRDERDLRFNSQPSTP